MGVTPVNELGSAELEVLKVLWEAAPLTVREVMDRLHARGRRVAYTTVLTFLSRLEAKGVVSSDKSEHAYAYRPVVSRERVTLGRVRGVVQELFDGAAGPLVLHLMKSERFSADEIARLQEMLDRMEPRDDEGSGGTEKRARPAKRG